MSKLIAGTKVKLKDSYEGYFSDYKGLELTVKQFYSKEYGMEYDMVKIVEIFDFDEYHLLNVDNFEVLS